MRMDKLDCDGVATVDRPKWETEAETHCKIKYEDEDPGVDDATCEVEVLRQLQIQSEEPAPDILLEDIIDAKAKLGKYKSSGGSSPTVNEWTKALPAVVLYWLLIVFNARL